MSAASLCRRCLTGTDDDDDGDCGVCARLPEPAVQQLREAAQRRPLPRWCCYDAPHPAGQPCGPPVKR